MVDRRTLEQPGASACAPFLCSVSLPLLSSSRCAFATSWIRAGRGPCFGQQDTARGTVQSHTEACRRTRDHRERAGAGPAGP